MCALSSAIHVLTLPAPDGQAAVELPDGTTRHLFCTAGAPADLVQIVTGYGEAGNALVTGGVDKLIFVGSTKACPCDQRKLAGLVKTTSLQAAHHATDTGASQSCSD